MVALSLRQAPLANPYFPDHAVEGVDEVFGLTAGLWPTMYRLAQILASKKNGDDQTVISTGADALMTEITRWDANACSAVERAEGECEVNQETTIQIANAYRFSALLVLHNEVLGSASGENLNSIYHQALDSVLRTAALDGPMATLVWPLFTVGRFSQSPSDRIILRHIFMKLFNRQHMRIVETAGNSIKSIWNAESEVAATPSPPVFFA